jgi:hypothetical protein
MTPNQRSEITNGIWLCQNCAKLVDNDISKFTVEVIEGWKVKAEAHTRSLVESRLSKGWADVLPEVLEPLVSLALTTPPPITENIAWSADGQFWLVYWDSNNTSYRWVKVTEKYALDRLKPVCEYRRVIDWKELF